MVLDGRRERRERTVDLEHRSAHIPRTQVDVAAVLITPQVPMAKVAIEGPASRFVGDRETNAHSTKAEPGIWTCRSRKVWRTLDSRTRVAMLRESNVIEKKKSAYVR